jgi:hypothetical protein
MRLLRRLAPQSLALKGGSTMRTDRKPVIDQTRVADGILFATHRLRCQYLGKTTREKPPWLEEHKGQFQRVEDVLREAASAPAPVQSEAASSEPNNQISSDAVWNDRDAEDHVDLVDTPDGDSSPSRQPKSLAEATKADLQAGIAETEGPKATATPVGAKGRKQARRGARRRKEQIASAEGSNACGKFSPERARIVLDSLSERPIQSYAAEKAGIHRKTLENWIKRSKAGEDGYDIEHEDVTMRFHVHCEWSKDAAYDKILEAAYLIAMGKAYVTDEHGNVTLETVRRPNLKMMRFLLEWLRPEVYGNKPPKPDVPQRSGMVLVVPEKPKRTCPEASIKARSWKGLSRKFRQVKD